MRRELEDLFPELDPPPHGYARLRAKIAGHDLRRRRAWRLLALAPVAAVVAVIAIFVPRSPEADVLRASENPALLRFGLAGAPGGIVEIVPRLRGERASSPVQMDRGVAFVWVEPAR